MNRRTFVIAVMSTMLATGALGGLVVAAEPIPVHTSDSPGRDGGSYGIYWTQLFG